MGILVGIVVAVGSLLGGFAAMGGNLEVLWQPWEIVIILGVAIGTYIVANPAKTVVDTGRAIAESVNGAVPSRRDYLDLLELLYALMRELRSKGRNEVEVHIENPDKSEIFRKYPRLLANASLVQFVCDYFRLIIIGNAATHEIEALMDEEISTFGRDKLQPYFALNHMAEALPALGIVAAVLGIIRAMGALDQSPQLLGGLIGAALIGTFAGIFTSYALVSPLAQKIKSTRERQARALVIVNEVLRVAKEKGPRSQEAITAIFQVRRLWIHLIEDLGNPGNALPDKLKADLISIGLWIMREAELIRMERSADFDRLIEINGIIREGLR